MKLRTLSASLILAGGAALIMASASHGGAVPAAEASHGRAVTEAPNTPNSPTLGVAAAIPDQPCDIGASRPKPPASDALALETWMLNKASQPVAPGTEPISRDALIELAAALSIEPSEVTPDRVAVAQLPYLTVQRLSGEEGSDALVAPTRCVWVVTAEGPLRPRSAPVGAKVPDYDSYTAVFDAATGEFLEVSAGPEAIDLITGAHTGSAGK